jgi:hypothetical protein
MQYRPRDISSNKPYDFEAKKGEERLFVEVKVTTHGIANVIALTHGEVAFQNARKCGQLSRLKFFFRTPFVARYRSFGLRFDLKRRRETDREFQSRFNSEMGDRTGGGDGDPNWDFRPKSVSAGSLYCDTWTGTTGGTCFSRSIGHLTRQQ